MFTLTQISTLRAEYSRINTIDPCGEAYPKLCKMLDALDKNALQQLAGAQIKFVSSLARNRFNRR